MEDSTIFFAHFKGQKPDGQKFEADRMQYFDEKKSKRDFFEWAKKQREDVESANAGNAVATNYVIL